VASAIFLIPPSCFMSNKEKVLSARKGHHMIKKELYGLGGNKHRPVDEYLVGCDGDHLLVSFECDLCIFRKLRNLNTLSTSEQDKLLLACIC
jgi:hypothetical protein